MKPINFLLLVLCLLGFQSCGSSKTTPETHRKNQLIFGEGGGIAGIETTFYLLDNGRLFVSKKVGAKPELVKTISKKEAKAFFERAKKAGLAETKFSHPSNMYFFMIWKSGEKENRITWGDLKHPLAEELRLLFVDLRALPK